LRAFIYAVLFGTLGWLKWNGLWAWVLGLLLLAEIIITLWDLVEEDRTRRLLAGERITHTTMAIVYGVFLAHLLPMLFTWSHTGTGLTKAEQNPLAWILSFMAVGLMLSGLRDLRASFHL
jgi:hypothetical protein